MSTARRLDELLQARYITRGKNLHSFSRDMSPWSYAALQGRLVSLLPGTMNAPLSALFHVVWDAQKECETIAWIGGPQSCFYPPDVAARGVDLNGITVIRLNTDRDMWFAADTLIRSGGVGMVIIDLASVHSHRGTSKGTLALQHRLSGLARTHNTAVIILPHINPAPEAGALVSLTVRTHKMPLGIPVGTYQLGVTPKRDKNGTANWKIEEVCDAPDGLC
jgi:recombination protein RecA